MTGVGGVVEIGAAVEQVVAGLADQSVAAGVAKDLVVALVADQELVVAVAAVDDVGVEVRLGRVALAAAEELVGAPATEEEVVALAAVEEVGLRIADQPVVEVGPVDLLDLEHPICPMCRDREVGCQVGVDGELVRRRRRGGAVVGGVAPLPAADEVGAGEPGDVVVAAEAVDHVDPDLTGDDVVTRRALVSGRRRQAAALGSGGHARRAAEHAHCDDGREEEADLDPELRHQHAAVAR